MSVLFRGLEKVDYDNYYGLLEEAFPPEERRKRQDQENVLRESEFHVYVPEQLGGQINRPLKAFLSAWDFGDFYYLEHFVVDKSLRGQGMGGRLLQGLIEHLPNTKLVLEAEPPEISVIAASRVEFYKRNGFKFNKYKYIQPAYSDDCEPIPLVIMSYPDKLSEEEYVACRREMYKKAYKIDDAEQYMKLYNHIN